MNSISSLQREDGTWCDDAEEVKEEVLLTAKTHRRAATVNTVEPGRA
jgi:hypothetical protein